MEEVISAKILRSFENNLRNFVEKNKDISELQKLKICKKSSDIEIKLRDLLHKTFKFLSLKGKTENIFLHLTVTDLQRLI